MEADAASAIRCIVGLGNPGSRYRRTRHNLGFCVVDELVARWGLGGPRAAFGGLVWDARRDDGRVLLLEPQAYMNRSGQAVAELAAFYKIPPAELLVVMDDLALPPGQIRARTGGSAGGHKGLADIQRALGGNQVPRLRIGIGAAPGPMDPADYVLMRWGPGDEPVFREAVLDACEAVEDWLRKGITYVMDRYNRRAAD